MKFSYQYLKKMIPELPKPDKLADLITNHAFEVESFNDKTIDINIPANRYSDAASHFGLAVIIGAILGKKFKYPTPNILKKSGCASKNFSIKIVRKNKCFRYRGLYLEIDRVEESPMWIQNVLINCGLRPINIIVDLANLIMLEIGQPIHAFDYDKIAGKKILVRDAINGEEFETLDNRKLILGKDDLVIADDEGLLALAGIKGGKKAEIGPRTKRIVIESANFDPASVFKTSKKLNLVTDASIRFSHAISHELAERGIQRAAELFKRCANAKIGDWLDVLGEKIVDKFIKLSAERINNILGLEMPQKMALQYLNLLDFGISKNNIVRIPRNRPDINHLEDIAEELVNLYGYDRLPVKSPYFEVSPAKIDDKIQFKKNIVSSLIGCGLSEVYNYSFISKNLADSVRQILNFWRLKKLVELENPISEEFYYLRPTLSSGLLKNIVDNLRFYDSAKIFEIGKIFGNECDAILERPHLGMAIAAKRDAFIELKGIIIEFLEGLGLVERGFADLNYRMPFFEAKESLRIESDHKVFGYCGLIKKDYLDLKQNFEVAIAEIDIEKLFGLVEGELEYEPMPKYPSVIRDISFLISRQYRVNDVLGITQAASLKYIADVDLIDYYEKPELGEGLISLTFRIVFRADDHTLTTEEVGKEMEKIISSLRAKFNIEMR